MVSATGSLAEECLRKIKNEIETNQTIMDDFGNVQSTKWTEGHIILKNSCQIRAKGAGYQIRGFRPDCAIVDDIENDESVRSEEQREKLDDWFWTALVNTLEPTSQLLVVGTLLHPLSFLTKLIDEPRPGWFTKKYKAIQEDGTPLWEEKWPLDKLEARKIEIGERRFRSEFMNDPLADSDVVFTKEWIDDNSIDFPPKRAEISCIMAIDPAISKKDLRDFTAIVTIGIHKETGHITVMEAKRGKWSIYETVDEIVASFKRFHPRRIVVEEVAYQAALKQVALKESREVHKLYLPIRPVIPDVDKVRRARAVSHMVENGAVHLLDTQEDLRNEMVLFPNADHDDMVDALVYALTEVNTGESAITKPKNNQTNKPKVNIFSLEAATRGKRHKAWYNH